jgi:4-hydroxy-tetrahydrodipicolinate synthase
MIDAVANSDIQLAREIAYSLVPITEGIMTKAQGAIMVKAALDLLGRAGGGTLRLPLVPATEQQRAILREDLIAGGISL